MKKHILLPALLLAATSAQAVDAPQWNQISLGIVSADVDEVDTFTGAALAGTFLLNENIFIGGHLESTETDITVSGITVDSELNRSNIGIGYRYGVTSSTDIYGKLSAERYEVVASSGNLSISEDANGGGFELGLRSMLTDSVEFGASAKYLKLSVDGDDETDTLLGAFGSYHFNEKLSLALSYSAMDDADFTELKGAYSF